MSSVLGRSLEDLQQILHLGVNAEQHHGRVQEHAVEPCPGREP